MKVLVNRGWVPTTAKPQRAEERERVVRTNSAGVSPVQEQRVVVRKGEKGAWYMPAAGTKDRSWTWTDLVSISELVGGCTVTPPPADDPKAAGTGNIPLYFDAVAAAGSDGGGGQAAADASAGNRKLHPMQAASTAAHALAKYESEITAPQPRLVNSYGEFPVTPWKHQV